MMGLIPVLDMIGGADLCVCDGEEDWASEGELEGQNEFIKHLLQGIKLPCKCFQLHY